MASRPSLWVNQDCLSFIFSWQHKLFAAEHYAKNCLLISYNAGSSNYLQSSLVFIQGISSLNFAFSYSNYTSRKCFWLNFYFRHSKLSLRSLFSISNPIIHQRNLLILLLHTILNDNISCSVHSESFHILSMSYIIVNNRG